MNVGEFNIVSEVSKTVLFPLIIFVLFYSMAVISTYLSSSLLIHLFFAWYNLLLIRPCVFFISVIALLISVCLFFSSLIFHKIFILSSQSVPPFFFWDLKSPLLSIFSIIFRHITYLHIIKLFFWGFILLHHMEHIFMPFHFVSFYVYCRLVIFLNLGQVALCRRRPMCPGCVLPFHHWS